MEQQSIPHCRCSLCRKRIQTGEFQNHFYCHSLLVSSPKFLTVHMSAVPAGHWPKTTWNVTKCYVTNMSKIGCSVISNENVLKLDIGLKGRGQQQSTQGFPDKNLKATKMCFLTKTPTLRSKEIIYDSNICSQYNTNLQALCGVLYSNNLYQTFIFSETVLSHPDHISDKKAHGFHCADFIFDLSQLHLLIESQILIGFSPHLGSRPLFREWVAFIQSFIEFSGKTSIN